MKTIRSISGIPAEQKPSVIVLGNFDGFHKGHQVVVGEAGRIAKKDDLPLAVFTTEPHPRSFFAALSGKPQENFRLTAFKERRHLLEKFGVDILYVLNFDEKLASTQAEDFVQNILIDTLKAKHIVVGYDYRFGKGRVGDVNLLDDLSKRLNFGLTVINPVAINESDDGVIYSSSLVRDAIKAGKVKQAAKMLGHWWTINGVVIDGDKRGRELGYPTANIDFGDSLVPLHGIYAVRLRINDSDEQFEGVANIGRRPTFGAGKELLEVYIFDFEQDIYGIELEVEIVDFIRTEENFENIEELVEYIEKDCIAARKILADPQNAKTQLEAPSLESYLKNHPQT